MALDQTANFVRVNVEGSHSDTVTTIQLGTGEASDLPDPSNGEYNLVWWNDTQAERPSADPNVEIIRVTGRDTGDDTITVERGQEDTSAVSHDNSDDDYRMILGPTSKMFDDIEDVTNLSGSSGSDGQVLQTDGTNLSFADVTGGMTVQERQAFNDVVAQLARNDFADNLGEMAYDGGFFDIFADLNKVVISPAQDGFEDGDYTSNPTWSEEISEDTDASISVQSDTVLNGSNALNIQSGGAEEYDETVLVHNNGGVDSGDIKWVFWMRADSGSEGTSQIGIGNGFNSYKGWNDGIAIQFIPRFDSIRFRSYDSDGEADIFETLVDGVSADTWYKGVIEVDNANDEATITIYDVDENELGSHTGAISSADVRNYSAIGIRDSSTQAVNFYFDDLTYDISAGDNLTASTLERGDSNGKIELQSGATNGSFTSIQFDLADDGFSNPPTSVVLSQEADIPTDEDIQYVVRDENDNTVTVTQADVDTEVDCSNFTSTVVEIETQLSSTDGDDTPILDDYMAHFKE